MPHLVLGVVDCRVELGDESQDFEVVAAIYAETRLFNRSGAFSQLSQGKLNTTLTLILIGREPKHKRITIVDERVNSIVPTAKWTKERYAWSLSLAVGGYSGFSFWDLRMDLIYDLKSLVVAVLAPTFDVDPDRGLLTQDWDLNIKGEVYNDWKGALTSRVRSSI